MMNSDILFVQPGEPTEYINQFGILVVNGKAQPGDAFKQREKRDPSIVQSPRISLFDPPKTRIACLKEYDYWKNRENV